MRRLLVLLDLSDMTAELVQIAADLSQSCGAEVLLLHVTTPDADLEGGERRHSPIRLGLAGYLRERRSKVRGVAARLRGLGLHALAITARSRSHRGNPVEKIRDLSGRLKPDLLIIGSHQRGIFSQLLAGSVSAAVVRQSRCPVLIVPVSGPGDSRPMGAALHSCGSAGPESGSSFFQWPS